MMQTAKRTVRDAIYGVAVGDALGVPVEFKNRDSYHVEGMTTGGIHGRPAGTFSDDTSMTIAAANSIRIRGGIDVDDMAQRFVAWLREGAYTVDGCVFDVGTTTVDALSSGRGLAGESNNGNGSLMRIVPLAFVEGVTDAQIEAASAITHAHAWSKRACVLYVRFAQDLLASMSVAQAIDKLSLDEPYQRLRSIGSLSRSDIKSTGFVVATLEAALWCLATTNTYAECVLRAVNLGDDTDTVGAVAGGLAGIVYGYEGIPSEWISALRGRGVMEACLF